MHAKEIEYRYVRVRELRRLGAKHRPGSTGCIEKECVQAGNEKELPHKGRLEKAADELGEISQYVSGGPYRTAFADRCTYSVGYGICSRLGATGTGPVRREVSSKKLDKSSRAVGERNLSSGRKQRPLKEDFRANGHRRHRGTGALPSRRR